MAKETKFDVKVVISAVDNATAEFKAINKSLANSPLSKLQKSFGSLAAATGVNQVQKAFSNVGSAIGNVASEAGALAAKVAGFGTVAGAGLFTLTKNFADFGDQVKDASQRLGISTGAYQEFLGAAKLAGVEQETFNGALDKFSKFVGDAALKGSESGKVFKAMGVNMLDASGKILPMEKILPNVIAKLNTIENAQIRASFGAKLFGKQFGDLVPLVEEFNEKTAISRQFIISEEEINQADSFIDTLNELKLVFSKVLAVAGSALLPAFKEIFGTLQTMLMNSKGAVKDFFKTIGAALPSIVASVASLVKQFAAFFMMKNEAGEMVLNMTKIKIIFAAIAAISAAPLIMSIISLGSSLWTLGTTLWGFFSSVTAFFGTLKGASILLTIFQSLGTIIGALLTPIGAVIAAGVALYTFWKPFRDLVNSIFGLVWSLLKLLGRVMLNSPFIQTLIIGFKLLAGIIGFVWEKVKAIGSFLVGKAGKIIDKVSGAMGSASGGIDKMMTGPTISENLISSFNSTTTEKQEAAVTVNFENLPQGAMVKTENKQGMNLDVVRGLMMVPQ